METVIIQKSEIAKIIASQEELKSELKIWKELLIKSLNDEIKPNIKKRLNERSARIESGKGKKFSNSNSVKSYLKSI